MVLRPIDVMRPVKSRFAALGMKGCWRRFLPQLVSVENFQTQQLFLSSLKFLDNLKRKLSNDVFSVFSGTESMHQSVNESNSG